MAKKLGSLGGKARAKKLSTEHRRKIASLGGMAKATSFIAAKRIRENFSYLDAIRKLRQKTTQVNSINSVSCKLPGILGYEK